MTASLDYVAEPADNDRLATLCGQFDEHLKLIASRLDVEISHRGNHFSIIGEQKTAARAASLLEHLYAKTAEASLVPEQIHLALQESGLDDIQTRADARSSGVEASQEVSQQDQIIKTRRATIQCRGQRQSQYVASVRGRDLTFGIGPAGTGKTFLAVACAVEALEADEVQRLVLVRPAVEAGERLGFLPGDMMQKVDPYLRPIYDALYEFLGIERVSKLVERNVIEIAPLAYMRGRTLNHSFVIMDEAQNTTVEQMKMFLTRIGFGSSAVVTGDTSQVDLPRHQLSGLKHVQGVLEGVDGVGFCRFQASDVVRHPLVQRIVAAYDRIEAEDTET